MGYRLKRPKGSRFVGIHDLSHHASVATIEEKQGALEIEIHLLERLSRVKADSGPLLKSLPGIFKGTPSVLSEVAIDVVSSFPWKQQNPNSVAHELPHHECHAFAATLVSPFKKSVILVMDGTGTCSRDFPKGHDEIQRLGPRVGHGNSSNRFFTESYSVYLQDGARIRCVEKEWQEYVSDKAPILWKRMGLGMAYALSAQYIFGSHLLSGKLMGLAAFGEARPIKNITKFCLGLDPEKKFRGRTKKEWETSPHKKFYADVAATIQRHFEEKLLELAANIREKHEGYENLILTGGCALNCPANQKIFEKRVFKKVYVPPFPGDECVALGAASALWLDTHRNKWKPRNYLSQFSNFGPLRSEPVGKEIQAVFSGFKVIKTKNAADEIAEILNKGHLVAWFQGRSESGPRSLGFRSLLGDPRILDLKKVLNDKIKKRESFRPYACSLPLDKTPLYFEVSRDFESPFMSFSPRVRDEWRERLKEVVHIDGTSRLQTVRRAQNPRFYDLLMAFGKKSGLYCLLNTSLNVMGEPIAETIDDARRFLETTLVDTLVVGDYIVRKPQ